MEHSTILKYKLKKSLLSVGIFYLFLITINSLVQIVISLIAGLPFDFNKILLAFIDLSFFNLIFFSILIGGRELKDYKLFSQFNVSRKRQILISCLQIFLIAFMSALFHFILIKVLSFGLEEFYSSESFIPYSSNPFIDSLSLLILIFLAFTLAGSLGLLVSYLYMRFSKLFIFTLLIGMSVTFLYGLHYLITNIEDGVVIEFGFSFFWIPGVTADGINPLRPLGIMLILTLINLGISKFISRAVDVKKVA